MNKKPVGLRSYREFRDKFQTELVYTRKDLADAIREVENRHVVNRVIQEGKDCNIALRILTVHHTDEGLIVIVK